MKRIYCIIILTLLYGINAQTVTVFNENFEGGFFPPNGWINVDCDSDGKAWSGENNINYSHGGSYFAKSISKDDAGSYTPNNWLITPKIHLKTGINLLKFWIGSSLPNSNERFKVVISELNPMDTTTFATILHSETLQNELWKEITVNLTPYAEKDVYIGFVHFSCTNQRYLRIDDIGITSKPDIEAPTVVDNTQTTFPVNQDAVIKLIATDYSEVMSADLYYRINNGAVLSQPMIADGNSFTATLPGQANGIKALYYAKVKDIANNTATTTQKQISWAEKLWFGWGTVYDNYGSGIISPSAPSNYWKAAVDFDFGINTYKIRKIESAMLYPENCMWKITGFNDVPLSNQIGDLVGFVDFRGNYLTDSININSNTILTSKFAVVINSLGNWMQMDQQGPDNHTFIADGDGVFKNLINFPGSSTRHGSWHIRVYAEAYDVGIAEEHEFIPGEISLANYPNPFNPTTTIKFFNNCSGNVNLTVYNYKGETVKELINSKVATGEHSVAFDGSKLSSGVYFYRLTTPVKSITGRMLLLK